MFLFRRAPSGPVPQEQVTGWQRWQPGWGGGIGWGWRGGDCGPDAHHPGARHWAAGQQHRLQRQQVQPVPGCLVKGTVAAACLSIPHEDGDGEGALESSWPCVDFLGSIWIVPFDRLTVFATQLSSAFVCLLIPLTVTAVFCFCLFVNFFNCYSFLLVFCFVCLLAPFTVTVSSVFCFLFFFVNSFSCCSFCSVFVFICLLTPLTVTAFVCFFVLFVC